MEGIIYKYQIFTFLGLIYYSQSVVKFMLKDTYGDLWKYLLLFMTEEGSYCHLKS